MSLSGSRSELRVARQELERLHDLITQRHQDLANRVDDFEVAKRRWKMRMHDTLRDVVAREERRVKHTYEEKLSRLDGLLFQLKREVGSFRQLREQAEALRVERDVCRRELQRAQEAASKRAREAKALENENKDLRKRVEIAQWRVGKLREEGREARRRQRAQPSLPAPPSTRSPAHRRSGAQDAAPVLGVDGASQFLDAAVRVLEAPLPKAADGDAHSPAAFAGGGPSALAARMRARTDDALPYLLPAICEVLPHAPYRATDETQRLLRFIWAAVYFTPRSSHDSSPAVGVGVGSSVPPGARAAFRLHRIIETLSAPVAGGPGAGEAQRSRGAPHSAERGPVAVPGSQPAHESHASPAPSVAISVARDGAGGGYSPFLAHSDPLVRTLSALLVARFARHTDAVTSALRVIRREVGTEQGRSCFVTFWGLLALTPLLESRLSTVTRLATAVLLAMASRGSHRPRLLAMCAQPFFLAACSRAFAPDHINALTPQHRAVLEAMSIVVELMSEKRSTRRALSQAKLVPRLREWVHCGRMIADGDFLVTNLRTAVSALQRALVTSTAENSVPAASGSTQRTGGTRRSASQRGVRGRDGPADAGGDTTRRRRTTGGKGRRQGRRQTRRGGSGGGARLVSRVRAEEEEEEGEEQGAAAGVGGGSEASGDEEEDTSSELAPDEVAVLGLVADLEDELASAVFSGPDPRPGAGDRGSDRAGRSGRTALESSGRELAEPRHAADFSAVAQDGSGAGGGSGRRRRGEESREEEEEEEEEESASEISDVTPLSGEGCRARERGRDTEEDVGAVEEEGAADSDDVMVYSNTLATSLKQPHASAPLAQRCSPASSLWSSGASDEEEDEEESEEEGLPGSKVSATGAAGKAEGEGASGTHKLKDFSFSNSDAEDARGREAPPALWERSSTEESEDE